MGVPDQILPENQLQVGPSAGLSPVATPDAFGSGIGQAAGQLGEVQTRLWHDANASVVMRAHNDVDAHANATLYDRKTGLVYQNLGENAPPAVDTAASDYKAKVSEVRGGLQNDAQRAMFDKSMGEHGMLFARTLSEYEHKQVTTGQNAQTQAYIQNRQTDIAQHYDNPVIVAVNIAQQKYALVQAYARNTGGDPIALQKAVDEGKAPDALKELLTNRASDAHMSVIDTALANDQNGYGKAYFEAHKAELNARDLNLATKMVRVGSQKDESRSLADRIIGKNVDDSTDMLGGEDKSGQTEEKALADLEKLDVKDTTVYDNAKDRIKGYYRDQRAAHLQAQGETMESIGDALSDESNANYDVPANLYAKLDMRGQAAIDQRQRQLRKYGRTETDPEVKYQLRAMRNDPQQWDAFLAEPAEMFHGQLNNDDWKKYQEDRAYIQGQISRRDTKLSQGMVADKVANKLLDANLGALPKKTASGYAVAVAQRTAFTDQLNRAVQADALVKKRELTPTEIEDHAKDLLTETTWQSPPTTLWQRITSDPFWAPGNPVTGMAPQAAGGATVTQSGRAFEAPTASKQAYSFKDIPVDMLTKMKKRDNAAGVQRSDDQLVKDYNDRLAEAYSLSLAKP